MQIREENQFQKPSNNAECLRHVYFEAVRRAKSRVFTNYASCRPVVIWGLLGFINYQSLIVCEQPDTRSVARFSHTFLWDFRSKGSPRSADSPGLVSRVGPLLNFSLWRVLSWQYVLPNCVYLRYSVRINYYAEFYPLLTIAIYSLKYFYIIIIFPRTVGGAPKC